MDFSDLNGRLSKEWIPQRAVEPFYSGGPVCKQNLPSEIKILTVLLSLLQVRVAIENEFVLLGKRKADSSEKEFHNFGDGESSKDLPMLVCVYDDNLAILKQTDKGVRKLELLFDKVDTDDEQLFDGTKSLSSICPRFK